MRQIFETARIYFLSDVFAARRRRSCLTSLLKPRQPRRRGGVDKCDCTLDPGPTILSTYHFRQSHYEVPC